MSEYTYDHTYATPGEYTPKFKVKNSLGIWSDWIDVPDTETVISGLPRPVYYGGGNTGLLYSAFLYNQKIYAVSATDFLVSDYSGNVETLYSGGITGSYGITYIFDDNHMLFSAGASLYVSADGGQTWTNPITLSGTPFSFFANYYYKDGTLYLVNTSTIYYTSDMGATWNTKTIPGGFVGYMISGYTDSNDTDVFVLVSTYEFDNTNYISYISTSDFETYTAVTRLSYKTTRVLDARCINEEHWVVYTYDSQIRVTYTSGSISTVETSLLLQQSSGDNYFSGSRLIVVSNVLYMNSYSEGAVVYSADYGASWTYFTGNYSLGILTDPVTTDYVLMSSVLYFYTSFEVPIVGKNMLTEITCDYEIYYPDYGTQAAIFLGTTNDIHFFVFSYDLNNDEICYHVLSPDGGETWSKTQIALNVSNDINYFQELAFNPNYMFTIDNQNFCMYSSSELIITTDNFQTYSVTSLDKTGYRVWEQTIDTNTRTLYVVYRKSKSPYTKEIYSAPLSDLSTKTLKSSIGTINFSDFLFDKINNMFYMWDTTNKVLKVSTDSCATWTTITNPSGWVVNDKLSLYNGRLVAGFYQSGYSKKLYEYDHSTTSWVPLVDYDYSAGRYDMDPPYFIASDSALYYKKTSNTNAFYQSTDLVSSSLFYVFNESKTAWDQYCDFLIPADTAVYYINTKSRKILRFDYPTPPE